MASGGSSHGLTNVVKTNLKDRFIQSYNNWEPKSSEGTQEEENRVETDSKLPKHTIFGFENENKAMENFLLDQKVYKNFKTLVIVGEYGVGKTTLCQKIFNNEVVKSIYAPRIWVSMETKETLKDNKKIALCKKILKQLGVEDKVLDSIHTEAEEEARNNLERRIEDGENAKDKELAALLYALHLNLRLKKYLIVFDDIREEDKWNEILEDDLEKLKKDKKWGKYLSDGFPKGSGGRVIYTTRDDVLARKLVREDHEVHVLWPLSDHMSVWKIYEEFVVKEKGEDAPRNDKKCYDELMNKSRGLPLAVRLIAELDPVFLDDETVVEDGPNNGQADQANSVNNQANQTNSANNQTNQTTP